jgi:hypothetical protein
MSYVLHSTPSGTPLASPRASAEAEAGGGLGDLEAPLLPGGGGTPPKQLFESGGVFKAITFGLINTCAGVVSWRWRCLYPHVFIFISLPPLPLRGFSQ